MGRRGQVEGAGERSAPVEQERAVIVLAVADTHAADVPALQIRASGHRIFWVIVGNVDTAKHQTRLRDVECVQLGVQPVILGLTAHQSVGVRIVWVDVALHFL